MLKFLKSKKFLLSLVTLIIVVAIVYVFTQKYGMPTFSTQTTQTAQPEMAYGEELSIVNIEDVNLGDTAKVYGKEVTRNTGFADLVDFTKGSVVSVIALKTSQTNTFNGIPLDSLDPLSREFLKRNMPPQESIPQRLTSVGSGFIVRSDGFVVTNFHVIQGAEQIKIVLNEQQYVAELYAKDEVTDIAVLKIEASLLPTLKFADSDIARVGETVLAIGNPFGLGGSVSFGIISAIGRDINMGIYNDFIQTDASINRGNSGGPLINVNGEVVGINTAIFSPSTDGGNVGIGFAVPSNTAKNVVAQLIANKKIVRSWLGVQIQPIDDNIAKIYNLKNSQGALVSSVVEGSPASKSLIKVGDIITEVNNKPIASNRMLPKLISAMKPNSVITLTVVSKKETKKVKVTLESIPDNYTSSEVKDLKSNVPLSEEIKEDAYDDLGIKVAELDATVRKYFDLPETATGVIIVGIKSASLAQQKGLTAGLIINEINQEAVQNLANFKNVYNKYKKTGLVMLVKDLTNKTLFISLSGKEISSGTAD